MEARPNEIGFADTSEKINSAGTERRIDGVALSRGIAIGRVVLFEREPCFSEPISDIKSDLETELERFREAVAIATEELRSLMDIGGGHVSDILNIQYLILVQSSFVSNVEQEIEANHLSAEIALQNVRLQYSQRQESVRDPHLREKRLDIDDVCSRLAAILSGTGKPSEPVYLNAVVAAYELSPSDIVEIGRQSPAAIVTERGGWTSHSAILAREFQIPMISGVRSIETRFTAGETVIVDGQQGILIVEPSQETISLYSVQMIIAGETGALESDCPHLQTVDGVRITIRANADSVETYELAKRSGAEGIGLFRSESLIDRPGYFPDEKAQFDAYLRIGSAVGKDGVRIRTFDVDSERFMPAGRHTEVNPALGLRSIRFSLREQKGFRAQIRALLRASASARIDIVIPMVSGVAEVDAAVAIINEESERLSQQGLDHGSPKIGAMIEIPSAVFVASEIAAKVDFLALGTNDLVQYLLAVDRDNDQVSELYQTLNPAVIRSLKTVIAAAEGAGKPLIVCGEMAGSPFYIPLLIGLGATELSINVNSFSVIRRLVSDISSVDARLLVDLIYRNETADQVESTLRNYYKEHWHSLFPAGLLDAKHR